MTSMSTAETTTRNDSARGAILLFAGLFILFFAVKYLLIPSGLVDRPAPGSVIFHVFDFIGIL